MFGGWRLGAHLAWTIAGDQLCLRTGPLGRPRTRVIRTLVALGRGASATGTMLRLLPSAGVGVWSGAATRAVEPPSLEAPAAPRTFTPGPAVFPAGPARPSRWAKPSTVLLAVLLADQAPGSVPVSTGATTLTGTSVGPAVLEPSAIATRSPLIAESAAVGSRTPILSGAAVRTEAATTLGCPIATESTAITLAPVVAITRAPVVVPALGPVVAIGAAGVAAVTVIPVRPIGGARSTCAAVAWPAIGERSPVVTRGTVGSSVLIPRRGTPAGTAVVGPRPVRTTVPSAASTFLAGGATAPVTPAVPTRARVAA